jgi:hypothetical protein
MSGRLDAGAVVEFAARMGISIWFYRRDIYAISATGMATQITPSGGASEPQIPSRRTG